MKLRALNWLACPLCRGALEPHATETLRGADVAPVRKRVGPAGLSALPGDDRILSGALACPTCRVYYPVRDAVPRMLTYPTGLSVLFARENADWLAESLGDHRAPGGVPPKGEEAVLRNFSAEWTEYEWTGESYWNLTPQSMLAAKRYELGASARALGGKLVLEVGIGVGGTADALARSEGCDVVGMDLGYAVDRARHYFGENPRLHIVQGSVFAPPFRPGCFDVAYSHGVLHHTYSTRAAFACVAGLPRSDGGMLYVWLYSKEQERHTPLRRALMGIERVVRPIVARLPTPLQTACLLPAVPVYIAYQNLYARRKLGREHSARYGWNEALHAARDRLTPPFAFRHTYEEVASWFREEGFAGLEFLRDEPIPPGVPESYPLNVGIRGFLGHPGGGASEARFGAASDLREPSRS